MFIGHPAIAFAAKRVAPRTSLGVLMAAALLPDLIWPVLILAGVERVRIDPGNTAFTPLAFDYYPFSHSLAISLALAAIVGAVYWRWTHHVTGAWVVGACVFSHWILDWSSHRSDVPIAPGLSAHVGLGLWNSVPATMIVELTLFAVGVWLYTRTTRTKGPAGLWSLWSLVAVLVLIYLSNIFGPSPPSAQAVAWVGIASWLFPFWATWVDRERIAISRKDRERLSRAHAAPISRSN